MTKLQKFNQYIFAIFGTIALISIIFLTALELYREMKFYNYEEPKQLSDNEVRELMKKNKFVQTISYESSYWAGLDVIQKNYAVTETIKSPYYVIPVSFTTLKNEQDIPVRLPESPSQNTINYDYDYYTPQQYSNVLIYNSKTKKTHQLFNNRVTINTIRNNIYNSELFLSLTVKDNVTGFDHLYIYKLKEQSLIKIEIPPMRIQELVADNRLAFILIRSKEDFDQNGVIDRYDPTVIYSWNYETEEIKRFPDQELHDSLQKILDGRTLEPAPAAQP
jgi:hypothetical protein